MTNNVELAAEIADIWLKANCSTDRANDQKGMRYHCEVSIVLILKKSES